MAGNKIIPDTMLKTMAESNIRSAHTKAVNWLEEALRSAQDEATREAIGMALDEVRTAQEQYRIFIQ